MVHEEEAGAIKMAKLMTWKVWLALIFIALAVLAIKPRLSTEGIFIKSVAADSALAQQGLEAGQRLLAINNQEINSLEDFSKAIKELERPTQEVTITTDSKIHKYNITDSVGFTIGENLTVADSEPLSPISKGERIEAINKNIVTNNSEFNEALKQMLPKEKIEVRTDKGSFAYLGAGAPKITAAKATATNLKKGLDLEGGTRVLLKPIKEDGEVTAAELDDMIRILDNRLNVYGLSDMRIRASKDWQGNKYLLIEIAGISKDEVMELIGKQGKFEAKIGDKTVFEGGKEDIPFVCKDDGTCSGVRACNPGANAYFCNFEFAIRLSQEAAKRHAEVTGALEVITSEEGKEILSEKLDFYLDGKKVDSLQIGADLKGREATEIAISGPGVGTTKAAAIEAAAKNMGKLQTILITGSLPLKLQVEKLDSISPILGKQFVRTSIIAGLLAIAAVTLVIIARYRSIKLAIPVAATSAAEVTIILGVAALTGWNLDMAAIAGIIAAAGTGVDAQIIILDGVMKKKSDEYQASWKQKIKDSFFIIFAAYATVVVAMLPLFNAGAGMLRGFALTTIVGVTIGVLITRPAFADFIKGLYEDKQ